MITAVAAFFALFSLGCLGLSGWMSWLCVRYDHGYGAFAAVMFLVVGGLAAAGAGSFVTAHMGVH